MANNGNKIVDSDINCTKPTDCFVYYNNPNATNEGSLMTENHKFFRKIFKYLMRPTERIIQHKKKIFNTKKKSANTLSKSEENIATCTSLSSIVDNIIKSDAKAVAEIKQRMIDATTFTARSDEGFEKEHENLSGVAGPLVRGASYRYAQYAPKYVDNVVPERDCGSLCINIGIQSDTGGGEFSLRTSPDAFAKACEQRWHADFVLEKIAKVSDALKERARLVSANRAASILASVSATSTGCEMEKETFPSPKPSIPSIICEEKTPTVAVPTMTVMQPETQVPTNTQVLVSSSLASDSRNCLACLDEPLDTSNIQVIPSVKHLRHTRSISCMYPERNYFRDIAVATVVREKKKEEEQLSKKIPTLDKCILATDKTNYAVIDAVIVNCISMLRKKYSKISDSFQPSDIQTDDSKQDTIAVKDDIIVPYSQISVKKEPIKEEPIQKAEAVLQESVSFSVRDKKPKYRAKYRIDDTSYTTKKEKVSDKRTIKDSDKPLQRESLFFVESKVIRSKSFNCLKMPTMEMYQDCQSKLLRCQQSIRYCEDLMSSNVCLGRSKCCDIWTTPCFSLQNEATRNTTLSHAHCRLPQDSCTAVHEYRANCHSLVDIDISCRCYTNDYAKRTLTFENALSTNTYCKNGAKYCYPRLNNIDVPMGYYHCNDSCPVWNNNQHCGRDRSCCWTKRNLYFTHPWTSKHLLRYN